MKRFAHVVGGIVVNISEALSAEDSHGGIELDSVIDAEIGIGDLYNGSTFSKPPAPPKSPEEMAKEARRAIDVAEADSVKVDNQVQTFLNFTQAELDAWIEANITGAGNKTAFKVLGRLAQAASRGRILR